MIQASTQNLLTKNHTYAKYAFIVCKYNYDYKNQYYESNSISFCSRTVIFNSTVQFFPKDISV